MLIGPRLSVAIAQQRRLAQEVAELNTQIATTKRIQRPSDDPIGAARIASIARSQADEASWLANIESASALAARVDTQLSSATGAMDQAIEAVMLARTGTASAADRAAAAIILRGLATDLRAAMTATDSRGQALFPAAAPLEVPVAKGTTLTATLSRDAAFGPAGASLADGIEAAAAALDAGDDASAAAALDALQAGQSRLTDARGAQGVRMARIDAARERLVQSAGTLTEERAAIEATDITRATPELQAKMLTLEAAQAAFARINRRTLFDLLG